MTKRRFFSLIFMIALVSFFYRIYLNEPTSIVSSLYTYYIENSLVETSSNNAVTAIYLDYRIYDTLFETLTLLVSAIGVFYFSIHSYSEESHEDKSK